jgi:hypothetical protein
MGLCKPLVVRPLAERPFSVPVLETSFLPHVSGKVRQDRGGIGVPVAGGVRVRSIAKVIVLWRASFCIYFG